MKNLLSALLTIVIGCQPAIAAKETCPLPYFKDKQGRAVEYSTQKQKFYLRGTNREVPNSQIPDCLLKFVREAKG